MKCQAEKLFRGFQNKNKKRKRERKRERERERIEKETNLVTKWILQNRTKIDV